MRGKTGMRPNWSPIYTILMVALMSCTAPWNLCILQDPLQIVLCTMSNAHSTRYIVNFTEWGSALEIATFLVMLSPMMSYHANLQHGTHQGWCPRHHIWQISPGQPAVQTGARHWWDSRLIWKLPGDVGPQAAKVEYGLHDLSQLRWPDSISCACKTFSLLEPTEDDYQQNNLWEMVEKYQLSRRGVSYLCYWIPRFQTRNSSGKPSRLVAYFRNGCGCLFTVLLLWTESHVSETITSGGYRQQAVSHLLQSS
jgi:hypothetical protein